MKEKKNHKIKNKTYQKIQLLILVISLGCLLSIYISHRINPIKEVEAVIEKEEQGTKLKAINPIDFDSYWNINKDVYAYIYIDGTKIDYPILQHSKDNNYYLDYTLENKKGYPGSIYTEIENAKDFNDPNTVIYGHNMKDGSMFHILPEYKKEAFFKEHPYIYIYTPESIMQYELFAAYTYDDRHLLSSFDFKDKEVFSKYLETFKNIKNGYRNNNVKVDANSQIITLSTCTYNDESRVLVQAVLNKKIECKYKTEVKLADGEKALDKSKIIKKEEN